MAIWKTYTDKVAFVKLHLIPTDETLWTEDKFKDFTEKRAELIITKLTKHTA